MPPPNMDTNRAFLQMEQAAAARTRFQYGCAIIEGCDVPMRAYVFTGFYRAVEPGEPQYRQITINQGSEDAVNRETRECRRRILEGRVPTHIMERERRQLACYNGMLPKHQEELLDDLAQEAAREGLPLFFACFARHATGGGSTVSLYYPGALPMIVCLEMFQSAIRELQDQRPL